MNFSHVRFFYFDDNRKRNLLFISLVFAFIFPPLSAGIGGNPAEYTHAHTHIYLNKLDFDHHNNGASHHKSQAQAEPSQVILLLENLANSQLFICTIPLINRSTLLQKTCDPIFANMETAVLGVQLIFLPLLKKPPRFYFPLHTGLN